MNGPIPRTYTLTMTETQARVLKLACEVLARGLMGQDSIVQELLNETQDLDERRAWDAYQVIRHRLAWDQAGNPPTRPSIQVWYDTPLNTAGETLIHIRRN